MKNLLLISLVAILAFSCTDTSKKKYDIKSATITYKNTMSGVETKRMVYFKDYGDTEATSTDVDYMGMTGKQHTLQKEGYFYMYLESQNQGIKMKMADTVIQGQIINEQNITKEHGKKTGTEKVLGKECTVYELGSGGESTKIWVWKKILLKVTSKQQGMESVMEATEVKESSDFPAGTFDLPTTVVFKDLTNGKQDYQQEENMQNPADSLNSKDFEDTTAKG